MMGTRTEPDVMVPEGAAQEGTRPWPTGNMRDVMAARAAMQEVQLRREVFRQLGVEDPMADMLMMVAEIRSEDPGLPHPAAMDISEDEAVMTELAECMRLYLMKTRKPNALQVVAGFWGVGCGRALVLQRGR